MGKNVLIIYGGKSTEHDVSVITALQVYKKYKIQNADVRLCYINKTGDWYLGEELENFAFYKNVNISKLKQVTLKLGSNCLWLVKNKVKAKELFAVDFIINCCHGGDGENGNLTALFEMCNIPSSTGNSASLKVCMDKFLTKQVLIASDIPTIDFFVIDKQDWLVNRNKILTQIEQFGLPVVVKPATQGSSVGVCLASGLIEFEKAVNLGFEFGERVLVERAITNKREFNCCLINVNGKLQVSKIEEPIGTSTIISFRDKYLGSGNAKGSKAGVKNSARASLGMASAKRKYPAEISKKLEQKVVNYSKMFYTAINCNGVVRVDFILNADNDKIYLSEANAIPGSMGYYFWGDMNILEVLVSSGELYWRTILNAKTTTPIADIFK